MLSSPRSADLLGTLRKPQPRSQIAPQLCFLLLFSVGAIALELSNTLLLLQQLGVEALAWAYGLAGLLGLGAQVLSHPLERLRGLRPVRQSCSGRRAPLVAVALLFLIQGLGAQTGTIAGIRWGIVQLVLIQLWGLGRGRLGLARGWGDRRWPAVEPMALAIAGIVLAGIVISPDFQRLSAVDLASLIEQSLWAMTGLMMLAAIALQPFPQPKSSALGPPKPFGPHQPARPTEGNRAADRAGLLQRRFARFSHLWTGLWGGVQLAVVLLELWLLQQLTAQFGLTGSGTMATPALAAAQLGPLLLGLLLLRGSLSLWQQYGVPAATARFVQVLPSNFQIRLYRCQQGAHSLAWVLGSALLGLLLYRVAPAGDAGTGFAGVMVGSLWSGVLGAIAFLGVSLLLLLRGAYFRLLIHSLAAGLICSSAGGAAAGSPLPRAPIRALPEPLSEPLVVRAIIQALKAALRPPVQLVQAQQCLELLGQASPRQAEALIIPLLPSLPAALQLASLKLLEQYPSPAHEMALRHLLTPVSSPEVYGAALRYLLQIAPPQTAEQLRDYLKLDVPVSVRAVAAAFMLASEEAAAQRSGGLAFVHMLTHKSEMERLVAAEALQDSGHLELLKAHIPALLRDFLPEVRAAVLRAIARTRSQALYPFLLKALHQPLTQAAAQAALQDLGDAAIPLLQTPVSAAPSRASLGSVERQRHCWETLYTLGSEAALEALVAELPRSQGMARYHLLKLLLRQPNTLAVVHRQLAGATGIKALINGELWLLGHLYGALVDLKPKGILSEEERRFRESLIEQQQAVGERVLLMLRLLYPHPSVAEAARNLRQLHTIPQGMAQLERLLSPDLKSRVLAIFAARSARHKLSQLKRDITYEPLPGQQRLRSLLSLNPGLEDWPLACGFYLASQKQWRITDDQLMDALNHPNPTVQEAANAYLGELPPETQNRPKNRRVPSR